MENGSKKVGFFDILHTTIWYSENTMTLDVWGFVDRHVSLLVSWKEWSQVLNS